MELILFKDQKGISRLMTRAEAEEQTRDGTLVLVRGSIFKKDSDLLVVKANGEYDLLAECAVPEDGAGHYSISELTAVIDGPNGLKRFFLNRDAIGSPLVAHGNSLYTNRGLETNNLCVDSTGRVRNQSECYREDDGIWYQDDGNSKTLFGYHHNSGERPSKYGKDSKFLIGFEVEKSGWPSPKRRIPKEDILRKSGWTLERDSSVSAGFELVSPTYDVFSKQIEKDAAFLKDYFDVPQVNGAGGHTTVSVPGVSSTELLDKMSGWLPIILAMYRGRLKNSYCSAATISHVKVHQGDRKAIHNKGNGRVEFRIVSAVKSYNNFLWRIKLWRFIASNLETSFDDLIVSAIEGKFGELLRECKVYQTPAGLRTMLQAAVNIHNKYVDEGKNKMSLLKLTKERNVYSHIQKTAVQSAEIAPASVVE